MLMNLNQIRVLLQFDGYKVWRGEDPTLLNRFLVKELIGDKKHSAVHVKRLEEEAQFLNRFRHERILPVISQPEPSVLLLEDAQYTLEQLLRRRGRLTNEIVASVLKQILEGLIILHNSGFAHGSLSPHNVFVDPKGYVRLADFTGYRYERDPPRPGYENTRYLAPELINNSLGSPSPSSDLYNLGFLALELLAAEDFSALFGFDPSQTETKQWFRWHANQEKRLTGWRQSLPEVSQALADFIDALIEKQPSKRPFTAAPAALRRLSDLGLQSLRVLPSLEAHSDATAMPAAAVFKPPQRKLGPILVLNPRTGNSGHTRRVSPDVPCSFESAPDSPPWTQPLAMAACQGRDWHLYSLSQAQQTLHNRKTVPPEKPARLRKGDYIQLPDGSGWNVDLELQGTSVISSMDFQKRLHAGRGGDLYLAKWHRPRMVEDVAVRILPDDFGRDIEQVRRFLRAVPDAMRLAHRNIVRLRQAGRVRAPEKAVWFLAFEYMPNGSLRDRFRSTPNARLGLKSAKRIAQSIGQALFAASEIPTVHRNINPSCILFDHRDQVKLGDFTLARGDVQETMYDITRGKLLAADYCYQAPEMLAATGSITFRSDIYSLGVCLFEALAGQLPFPSGESEAAVITRMSRYEWPSICRYSPNVPVSWSDFLEKILSRNPEQRCESMQSFLDAIAELPVS
jgi:serine/threonine protein kinase